MKPEIAGYFFIAMAAFFLGGIVGCVVEKTKPEPVVSAVAWPQPIPDDVPNLSPEDFAAMSGFDASTEQTLREQKRNNDIEWRVDKLEREVRRLNQKNFGVAELRIGDDGQQPHEEQEAR